MAEFSKKILSNGMIVLHEKRDIDVTTVMLATKFGALYETEQEKGISHLIEHLLFKGTKKRSAREIAFELERVGGNLNAFTEEELIAYHVKLPSVHLDLAMDVIFDMFFNPKFDDQDITKEKGVICEEIKMYKDAPQRHVLDKIKSCLYGPPFGNFIAGNEKTVRNLKREDIIKKHEETHVAKNAILCVVGNNNFEEICCLAEKLSPKRDFKNYDFEKIIPINKREVEIRKEIEQANITLGFHFPFFNETERVAGLVFSTILGDGMSSKLFTEVREKRGLAYAVKTMLEEGKNYSYLVIYIGTEKSKVDEVIKICLEEFKKMGQISEKELVDGKQQVIGSFDVDSEGSDNTSLHLILNEIKGKAEDYYDFKQQVKKVSLADVKRLAEIKDYSSFVLS